MVELRGRVILGAARAQNTGQGGHDAGRRDFSNRIIVRVGHVDIPAAVDRQAERTAKTGSAAGAIDETLLSGGPGERRYDAGGGNFSNHVIAPIGNVKIAGGVDGQPLGQVELRRAGGTVGGPDPEWRAGIRGDDARRGDFPDFEITRVGHIDIAGRIDGDTGGKTEPRRAARAVRGTRGPPAARQGRNDSRRGNHPDRVVDRVGHVQILRRIDGDRVRAVEQPGGAIGGSRGKGCARERRKGVVFSAQRDGSDGEQEAGDGKKTGAGLHQ